MSQIFVTLLIALMTVLGSSLASAGNVSVLNYTTTSGSTTGYVQAIASTPITVSQLYICDTSGQVVKIAFGGAGSEVDAIVAPVSGCALFPVNPYLPAGSRISIRSATILPASTGYNAISLLP
jgi:hypothetical protein